MINHLSGKLIEKSPTHAVIECHGVGYYVHISLNTYSRIGDVESCRLFTHLQIREDAHTLFGFADEEERNVFRKLISVSGVGATTGRMILSSLSPSELKDAIYREDVPLINAVKGTGAKTSQSIIRYVQDNIF